LDYFNFLHMLNKTFGRVRAVIALAGPLVLVACGEYTQAATSANPQAVLARIDISAPSASIPVGLASALTATGTFSDGSTQDLTSVAAWTSSDSTVATVSSAPGSRGRFLGAAVGSVTLTATFGGKSGTLDLAVTAATLASIDVSPAHPMLEVGAKQQFASIGHFSDGTSLDLTSLVAWSSSAAAVATVTSKGLATGISSGNATIAAALGGITGTTTLAVTASALVSIDVSPTNASIAAGLTQQFTATGHYTDGSSVNLTHQLIWISSDATVATFSDDVGSEGLATGLAPGTVTVTASLGAINGHSSLAVSAPVLVSLGITPEALALARGTQQQFTATGVYSDGSTRDQTAAANWSSSNVSVATVSNAAGAAGLATGVNAGTTTLSASFGGMTTGTPLTVTAATLTSLTVIPFDPSIAAGTTQQFTALGTYSDNTFQDLTAQVTWSSSDTTIAAISNDPGSAGLAQGIVAGGATVTASFGGMTANTGLTVTAATLVAIDVSPAIPTIAAGTTQRFVATGTYSDSTVQDLTSLVTWSSSSTSTATVSNAAGSNGLAAGVAPGSADISATLSGVSDSTTLTVTNAVLSSLTIDQVDASIAMGTSMQFTVTGTFSDNSTQDLTTEVAWSSSSASVASVSNASGSEGLARGLAVGSTIITASLDGQSDTVTLTVTNAVLTGISVTPANQTIPKATTLQFSATGTFSDGSTQDLTPFVIWTSSNPAVASISFASGSEGLARGLSGGNATISASMGGMSGSTQLTVTNAALVSIAVAPVAPRLPVSYRRTFTATGTFSDGSTLDLSTQVAWVSSNPHAAVISNAAGSNGQATGLSAGTSTIRATLAGVAGSTTLTVTSASLTSIVVSPSTVALHVKGTMQLTATGTFSDGTTLDVTSQVSWKSSAKKKVSVRAGLVTAIKTGGSVTVTASKGHNGPSGSATVTVN
jgi:hypothetical protein